MKRTFFWRSSAVPCLQEFVACLHRRKEARLAEALTAKRALAEEGRRCSLPLSLSPLSITPLLRAGENLTAENKLRLPLTPPHPAAPTPESLRSHKLYSLNEIEFS
jgi:hypothetical protein